MRPSFPAARWALLWCLALLLTASCTDPYLPDAISAPPSYLVVDGFLNSQGVSTIRLSRSYAIAARTAPPAETRATAYLEEESGPRFVLAETATKGTYTSAALVLNPARRYRLHLTTQAGKEYASDYVAVKTTPPIDNVAWRTDNTSLGIYVNTHDAANASRYYRWDFEETWEIVPVYKPSVEYVNNDMRDIVVPYPTLCWGNAPSTAVRIAKTTALSQDVVSDFQLRSFPRTSELLYSKYSMLVRQYALTKEEYGYWELLRKNTESIGTLFDPQPAQLTGNVRCLSNPDDVALGYVGAHSVTEKRIFISRLQLPPTWNPLTGYESCLPPDTIFINRPQPPPIPAQVLAAAFNPATGVLPIDPVYDSFGLIGYTAKVRDCIDCRTRGTSVKPSFWP